MSHTWLDVSKVKEKHLSKADDVVIHHKHGSGWKHASASFLSDPDSKRPDHHLGIHPKHDDVIKHLVKHGATLVKESFDTDELVEANVGPKDGYYSVGSTSSVGSDTIKHHKTSSAAIRHADRQEGKTGYVHMVHHVKDGKIQKSWGFSDSYQGFKSTSDFKGDHFRESVNLDEGAVLDAHVKRLKAVKKNSNVTYDHHKHGAVTGKFQGVKRMGGRPYAHVEHGKSMGSMYVPVHQVKVHEGVNSRNLLEAARARMTHSMKIHDSKHDYHMSEYDKHSAKADAFKKGSRSHTKHSELAKAHEHAAFQHSMAYSAHEDPKGFEKDFGAIPREASDSAHEASSKVRNMTNNSK